MLRNKISSKSGATILLALLFFLLCAMAGSIVLSAGSAAAGRISGLAESEQAFYSVSSAAQALREEIEGQEFQYTVETVDEVPTKTYPLSPGGQLSALLVDATQKIFNDGADSYTDTLTINPSNEGNKKIIGQVTGEFTMDADYSITIVFRMENSEKYLCRLTVKALIHKTDSVYEKEVNGEIKRITKTDTHVYWDEGIIDKG